MFIYLQPARRLRLLSDSYSSSSCSSSCRSWGTTGWGLSQRKDWLLPQVHLTFGAKIMSNMLMIALYAVLVECSVFFGWLLHTYQHFVLWWTTRTGSVEVLALLLEATNQLRGRRPQWGCTDTTEGLTEDKKSHDIMFLWWGGNPLINYQNFNIKNVTLTLTQ